MSKANYQKVEESLTKGLEDIKIQQLQEAAKRVSKGEKPRKQGKHELTPKQIVTVIQQDLKWMEKYHEAMYKKLKVDKKLLKTLAEKIANAPEKLTNKDLKALKKIKKEVTAYKKGKCMPIKDEDLIISQRKGHIYKRHNVKEEWVPLDTHADLSEFET